MILIISSIHINAQWEIINQYDWGYMTSMDLVNETLGFITTDEGYILRTIDGGLNWEVFNRLKASLSDLQFIDENNGWVLARYYDETSSDFYFPDSMRLIRTTDGGETWNTLDNDAQSSLQYQFVTHDTGWAIRYNNYEVESKLIYTLDGGEKWFDADTNTGLSSKIVYFRFVDKEIGWAIGGEDINERKELYKTFDGGVSWTKSSYDVEILQILPVSDSTCYVIFEKVIHKTEDGGRSWEVYDIPFIPGSDLIAGGIGLIKYDTINDSTFIFTGSGGLHEPDVIYKTYNGFKNIETLYEFRGLAGYNGNSASAPSYVELMDGENGIAVNNSYILRTSDQGNYWDLISALRNFKQPNFEKNHTDFI
jgi:hypothetical protein